MKPLILSLVAALPALAADGPPPEVYVITDAQKIKLFQAYAKHNKLANDAARAHSASQEAEIIGLRAQAQYDRAASAEKEARLLEQAADTEAHKVEKEMCPETLEFQMSGDEPKCVKKPVPPRSPGAPAGPR